MSPEVVFTPSEFVAVLNQTLEFAYPSAIIEGELAEFRVSKNSWVYFKLKDEVSSVSFFGTVYKLPGPLEDGIQVRVVGAPRLHPRFGFSVNFSSISPVGEGSIKKAADLLAAKLKAEGIFESSRKRSLPLAPERVGLVTSATSAACADFMKVINERWGGVEVMLIDSLVQGEQAPLQLVKALEHFNQMADLPEVVVITRGGGSAEDLAAFSDERVVRAVAASRAPTLVAIGHEIDESLAEMAADARASTPTAAANRLVPDRRQLLTSLQAESKQLKQLALQAIVDAASLTVQKKQWLQDRTSVILTQEATRIASIKRIIHALSPDAILAKGYAILSKNGAAVNSAKTLVNGDALQARLSDGTIALRVEEQNG